MKKRNAIWRLARAWLIGLMLVALLGDFLANDRPLVAEVAGEVRFPVLHEYAVKLSLSERYQPVVRDWRRVETAWAVWPLVPYAASRTDARNGNYRSPFATQRTGKRARHYLGTDKLGRDVLAGLISGARVAVIVGFCSVLLSLLLGVPLGGVAGFFGNDRLRRPRYFWWGWLVGGMLGALYAYLCLFPFFGADHWWSRLGLLLVAVLAGGFLLRALLRLLPPLRKPMSFPADAAVLQGIELFVNVPPLVLLIAVLAIVNRPSLWVVVLVIGVLRWPYVARHLRAELLRIRSLPYVEAARVSGIPSWRILYRHALPNALGPVLVVSSFGLGLAILLESALSFLGLGVPEALVSWGSLLKQSRAHPEAWWMAVFPGLCLTFTVLAANVLGGRK